MGVKKTNKKHIGYLIKNIDEKLKAKANANLKEHGLTFAQGRVLSILAESKGANTTQKDLEEALGVSHPTMVGIISRMEASGFVICHQDTNDRRNKIVLMTEKAVAVGNNIKKVIESNENETLKPLSDSERKELVRMLTLIINNLN